MWELPVIGDPDGYKKFVRPGTDHVPLSVVKNYRARRQALIDLGFEVVTWDWDDAQDPPVVAKRVFAALERAETRRRPRAVLELRGAPAAAAYGR
jgi:hypothetical protein